MSFENPPALKRRAGNGRYQANDCLFHPAFLLTGDFQISFFNPQLVRRFTKLELYKSLVLIMLFPKKVNLKSKKPFYYITDTRLQK